MNAQLKALQAELQGLIDERNAMSAKARLDEADIERAPALRAEIEAKTAQIAAVSGLDGAANKANELLNGDTAKILKSVSGGVSKQFAEDQDVTIDGADLFRATRKLHARGLTPFMSAICDDRQAARDIALGFGHFALANSLTQPSGASRRWLEARGINPGIRAATGQTETIAEDGGYLVPEEFESAIIVLRELYGVFRQNAQVVPMGSDTKLQPRRTGGLTAYFIGDGGAITKSKAGWDRVRLVAKKIGALAYTTSELDEDSVASIGDLLIGEMAYAFAKLEDQCGFIGDGSQTYGGIVGVSQKLVDQFTTSPSSGDGLVDGAGNLFSEITMANFHTAQGVLPVYAEANAKWYCHKAVWSNVLMRLALASGGVPAAEIMIGGQKKFLGDPVVVTQAMPGTDANDQVFVVYGSLDQAAMLGNRRGITVMESIHDKFAEDEIAFRGTQRFDINVHSVTTPSGTPAAGPVVGIISAGS